MAAECCSSCEYQRTVGYPSTSWASCWKLALTCTPDPIRPTRRRPDPNWPTRLAIFLKTGRQEPCWPADGANRTDVDFTYTAWLSNMGCDAGSCVWDATSRLADLRQRLVDARCKALSTVLLVNGIRDFRPVCMKKNILNTCCDI